MYYTIAEAAKKYDVDVNDLVGFIFDNHHDLVLPNPEERESILAKLISEKSMDKIMSDFMRPQSLPRTAAEFHTMREAAYDAMAEWLTLIFLEHAHEVNMDLIADGEKPLPPERFECDMWVEDMWGDEWKSEIMERTHRNLITRK